MGEIMVVNESHLQRIINILGMPEQLENGFPSWCFVEDPASPTLIIVTYTVSGYRGGAPLTVAESPYLDEVNSRGQQEVETELHLANEYLGVTRQQSAAMSKGAMYGWDTPAAQLEEYWPDGTWKTKKSRLRRLVSLNLPLGERL